MAIEEPSEEQLSEMVMQSTMRAAVRDDYGDAEVIESLKFLCQQSPTTRC